MVEINIVDVSGPNRTLERLQVVVFAVVLLLPGLLAVFLVSRAGFGWSTLTFAGVTVTLVVLVAGGIIAWTRLRKPLIGVGVSDGNVILLYRRGHRQEVPFVKTPSLDGFSILIRPPLMSVVNARSETFWVTAEGARPRSMLTEQAYLFLIEQAKSLQLSVRREPHAEQGSRNSLLVRFDRVRHAGSVPP